MKLFISIESEKTAESGLSDIMKEIRNKLSFLFEDTDIYGTEFDSIAIIPTCVSDDIWQISGWKERKLISRNKKEADIRLKMDFRRFNKADAEEKYILFADIIVKSVLVVKEKSKSDFKGDKLIADIIKALNLSKEDILL